VLGPSFDAELMSDMLKTDRVAIIPAIHN